MPLPKFAGALLVASFHVMTASSAHAADAYTLPTVVSPDLDPAKVKYLCDDNGCVAQNYLELERCIYTTPGGGSIRIPTLDDVKNCIYRWQINYRAQCVAPVADPSSAGSAKGSGTIQPGTAKTLGAFCVDGGCRGYVELKYWKCIGDIVNSENGIASTLDLRYQQAAGQCAESYRQDLELCPTDAKPASQTGIAPGTSKPLTSVDLGTAR